MDLKIVVIIALVVVCCVLLALLLREMDRNQRLTFGMAAVEQAGWLTPQVSYVIENAWPRYCAGHDHVLGIPLASVKAPIKEVV